MVPVKGHAKRRSHVDDCGARRAHTHPVPSSEVRIDTGAWDEVGRFLRIT
jgi:hypothetical protein